MTPSLVRGGQGSTARIRIAESGFNARFDANRMEPLWSQAGATSGNQWQTRRAQKPRK